MNIRFSSIVIAILGTSILTVPAVADVYGVAEMGEAGSHPSSTEMSDRGFANLGGIYSPGYLLVATTSPSCFAGMTWNQAGKSLSTAQAGVSAPAFCSVSFEVPTGKLSHKSPKNPSLTIVVQDTSGDYFYAGKNQGVVPTYIKSKNGYDLFTLTAKNSDFNAPPKTRLTKIAAVWSGSDDTLPPIKQMYITRTLINSQDTVSGSFSNHVPSSKYGTKSQPAFDF